MINIDVHHVTAVKREAHVFESNAARPWGFHTTLYTFETPNGPVVVTAYSGEPLVIEGE